MFRRHLTTVSPPKTRFKNLRWIYKKIRELRHWRARTASLIVFYSISKVQYGHLSAFIWILDMQHRPK